MKVRSYRVVVEPLSPEDGTGFMAYYPDLPGCVSDGETREDAMANAQDALNSWIETALQLGRALPEPSGTTRRAFA